MSEGRVAGGRVGGKEGHRDGKGREREGGAKDGGQGAD